MVLSNQVDYSETSNIVASWVPFWPPDKENSRYVSTIVSYTIEVLYSGIVPILNFCEDLDRFCGTDGKKEKFHTTFHSQLDMVFPSYLLHHQYL